MIVEKGCFERGCACYDDRVDEGVGVDVFQKPANDKQILVMWRLSNGHALRFARLLESYHGIGEVLDA